MVYPNLVGKHVQPSLVKHGETLESPRVANKALDDQPDLWLRSDSRCACSAGQLYRWLQILEKHLELSPTLGRYGPSGGNLRVHQCTACPNSTETALMYSTAAHICTALEAAEHSQVTLHSFALGMLPESTNE